MTKPTVEIEVPGKATLQLEVSERVALLALNFVMAHYVAEKEKESNKRQEFAIESPRPKPNETQPTRGKR